MTLEETVTSLYEKVTNVIYQQLAENVVLLTKEIKPFFLAFLGVYMSFLLYQAINSQKEGFFGEMMQKIVAWGFVSAVLFTSSLYKTYAMPFVWEIGDHLSSFIIKQNSYITNHSTSIEGLSILLQKIEIVLQEYILRFSKLRLFSMDFGKTIFAAVQYFIVFISTTVFTIYVLAYLLIAKIFLGIVLSIAPIFICFVVFPATRGMFSSI